MGIRQLSLAAFACIAIVLSGNSQAGEQVTVDKDEYEQLKAAVKFLMSEREANQTAVEEARKAADEAAASAQAASETAEEASETAEEASEVAEAAVEAAESPILEGLANVSIGGYGEAHYNNLNADDSSNDKDEFDLHRFVLFFGYQFSDDLRFYSEFEIEHGGVEADGDPLDGEVEVEQAYVEWDFAENSSVLGGVFLLPVGLLNETHEPDTFYGVERNSVEAEIIPATWWAVGSKATHRFENGFTLEAAVHSGLEIDSSGGEARVRSGRQKASNADGSHVAYTAAASYTGIQGLEVGVAAQLQDDATQVSGDGLDDGVLLEGHVAYNGYIGNMGVGLRALYAHWDFDGDCDAANPGCIEIDDTDYDTQTGWFIEPSIKPLDNLGFFFRYEDVEGGRSRAEFDQWSLGVNFWLHENVVLKADYQDRSHDHDADEDRDFDGYNLGLGWSF